MLNLNNKRKVETALREHLHTDRARVQLGKISRFGLFEMSRQRLRPSLDDSNHSPCPRCDGQGTIRNVKSLSLSVLRIIEEEAMKDMTAKLIIHAPVDSTAFLLNEKRHLISEIQQRLNVEILIIPDSALVTPQYSIERIKKTDQIEEISTRASYQLQRDKDGDIENNARFITKNTLHEKPLVKQIIPAKPLPASRKKSMLKNIIIKFFKNLFGTSPKKYKKYNKNNRYRGNKQRRNYQSKKYQNKNQRNSRSSNQSRGRNKQSNTNKNYAGNKKYDNTQNKNKSNKDNIQQPEPKPTQVEPTISNSTD